MDPRDSLLPHGLLLFSCLLLLLLLAYYAACALVAVTYSSVRPSQALENGTNVVRSFHMHAVVACELDAKGEEGVDMRTIMGKNIMNSSSFCNMFVTLPI